MFEAIASAIRYGTGFTLLARQAWITIGVKRRTTASLTRKALDTAVATITSRSRRLGVVARDSDFVASRLKNPTSLRAETRTIIPRRRAIVLKSMALTASSKVSTPNRTIRTPPVKAAE